jgi:O-antigen/teichoic acid export membrane protein
VVMCSVPLLVLAPEILKFWIDPDFAAKSTIVFRLLVIAYGLLALAVVSTGLTAGLGHPELNTVFMAFLGIISLIGYYIFIPHWGINGAGMAAVCGSAVAVPMLLWYVNIRFFRVSLIEILGSSVVRPVLSGAIICAGLLLAKTLITNMVILLCALGASCIAYLGVSLCLKVWESQEINIAIQLWNRVRISLSPKKT